MVARGRGGGKTPERVVTLLNDLVKNTSQATVAQRIGLTRLTVQRYLKGIGEPTTETLEKIASYFGVSVSWLRGEGDNDSHWIERAKNLIDLIKEAHENRVLSSEEGSWFTLYYEIDESGFRCDLVTKISPQIAVILDFNKFSRLGKKGTDTRKRAGGYWLLLTQNCRLSVSTDQAEEYFKAHDKISLSIKDKLEMVNRIDNF